MKINLIEIAHHRNGICGSPFYAILFRDTGEESSIKIGVVFEETGCVGVLDVDKLAKGDVRFGSNSWRGDKYEPLLREAITNHLAA